MSFCCIIKHITKHRGPLHLRVAVSADPLRVFADPTKPNTVQARGMELRTQFKALYCSLYITKIHSIFVNKASQVLLTANVTTALYNTNNNTSITIRYSITNFSDHSLGIQGLIAEFQAIIAKFQAVFARIQTSIANLSQQC